MSALAEHNIARYTDGEEIGEGDKIRYRQRPGGMLPANPEWTYGTAEKFPHTQREIEGMRAWKEKMGDASLLDPNKLYLKTVVTDWRGNERTEFRHIVGHIVEREGDND